MAAGRTKLIRFESKAQKERIERAARDEKRSVNQFMLLAVEEKLQQLAKYAEEYERARTLHNKTYGLAEAEGLR